MEKERRIKTISVIALIVAVLGLTVAFAVLSANLVINGTAKVDPGKWDIHFENLQDATIKGKAKEVNKPKINESQTTKIEDINVTLTQPKDEVIYKVDLVNKGDIDAEISDIVMPIFSDDEQKYIEFNAIYDSDKKIITNGDVLKGNTTEKVTISIRFKEDVTELPSEDLNITLSYEINYVQSDSDSEENVHNGKVIEGAPQIDYKNLKRGDEVTLGTEHFYVIENGDTEVKLLAKYNLLVGNTATWYASITDPVIPIDPQTEGYGLQSEKAIATDSGRWDKYDKIGTIAFSESIYWLDESYQLKEQYGKSYPVDVYDENSNLYQYVEKYKKYLQDLGYDIKEARLITYGELIDLGCEEGFVSGASGSCENVESWLHSTTYWTGTASGNGTDSLFYVTKGGFLNSMGHYKNYIGEGLRPVIVLNK